jgi:hypothetical protein
LYGREPPVIFIEFSKQLHMSLISHLIN